LTPNYRSPLLLGAGFAILLLALNIALTFHNTRQLNEDNYWVAHTHEVMTGLADVLSLAQDAETGQRGYVITGESRYLEPYNSAINSVNKQVDELEQLTSDDPHQQARFPELRKHIAAKLSELAETVALRRNDGFDVAQKVVLADRGKNEMDSVRHIVGEMVEDEKDLLKSRAQKSYRTYIFAVVTGLLSGLSALGAIAAFTVLLNRHLIARAKASAIIAEQGERWRTTLASIGDAVISTDRDARITNMNSVAQSLTGWSHSAAIGQPLDTIFRIVNESTRDAVENPAIRALKEGIIVGLANHTILIAKDGSEKAIDDSAAPIRCKDGEIVGSVLVFRDVSERRQAERISRQDEARRTAMFETALDCVVSIDHTGTVVEFNAAAERTFGYSRDNVIGRELASIIIPPQYREQHRKGLAHYLETGEGPVLNQRLELSAVRADATEFPIELTVIRIPVDGPPLFTAFLRDITERRQAEQALRDSENREQQTANELRQLAAELSEADHRKNEFLAMLAHELRNPLAPIRNALQIVQLSGESGETIRSASEMMERQIAQLVRLVDDLLDVSRISRGKIELRREQVELSSIISQAIETTRPAVECAKHQLTVKLPSQPIYLDADLLRLAQVFSNLLNNSCKYTEPEGHISLAAEVQENEVVITVRDTGIGIPPEALPKVFDMFTQVDRSLERSQGGLGIGLTLVQRIVELHGGSVTATSAGVGRGSEFVVRLPMVVEQLGRVPKSDTGKTTPNSSHRILVADDNRDSALSLAVLLRMSGNETQMAHDGSAALEAAATFNPEIVLLDIGMPKMNGYEVARKLRETEAGKKMVLVALTGWGQEEDRQKSRDAGFDGHLVKPVEHEVLTRLLFELLSTPKADSSQ
jgi:PAS domain S-box-containing protein